MIRFQSIEPFRRQRLAKCVVTNASRQNLSHWVFTEQMTNGAFARVSPPQYSYVCEAGSQGIIYVDFPPGSGRYRIAAQYQVVPRTKLGKMFEPIRTRLLGERPTRYSYSEEFHTPP